MAKLTQQETEDYESMLATRGELTGEQSGLGDAILSGLTNSETAKTRWLANKRFPNYAAEGKDPVDLHYYVDGDGDIAFIDPTTNKPRKEFRELSKKNKDGEYDFFSLRGLDTGDVGGNVFPLLQFVSEVVPSTIAFAGGAASPGGIPAGMTAAAAANYVSGSMMYGVRDGITQLVDGPVLDTEQAINDLTVGSIFSLAPLGGGKKIAKGNNFLKNINTKFGGKDGKKQLNDILKLGGINVDSRIAYAKEKYGITLTRPEAMNMQTNSAALQHYLQMQPRSQKLWDFYHERNNQLEEYTELFFQEVRNSKLARPSIQKAIVKTGKKIAGDEDISAAEIAERISKQTSFGDIDKSMAEISERVLKQIAEKRKARAGEIYEASYEQFRLEGNSIDVTDILTNIEKQLSDKNVKGGFKSALEKVKKGLINQNTGEPMTDLKMLHDSLRMDFGPLLESLTKGGVDTSASKIIKRDISQIRDAVSKKLKASSPEFVRANEIFDPTKGHLQLFEHGLINTLAQTVKKGGAGAERTIKRMFTGETIPVKDIKTLRRALQTDPDGRLAWQNLKSAYLQRNFNESIAQTTNPLGVANKFLSRLGFKGDIKRAFPQSNPMLRTQSGLDEVGQTKVAYDAVSQRAKILKEILEPEELANFVDLSDMMQTIYQIARKSGSPTESFQNMGKILANESLTGAGKYARYALSMLNTVPRIINKGFSDVSENILASQKELYEDTLIDALIDPKKALELSEYLNAVKPFTYLMSQTFLRSGDAGLEALANSTEGGIDERNADIKDEIDAFKGQQIEEEYRQQQENKSINNQIDSVNPDTTSSLMNVPAFPAPMATDDPTTRMALAGDNPDNQLIARRGIASLA